MSEGRPEKSDDWKDDSTNGVELPKIVEVFRGGGTFGQD
jgi:hypothetical protein